MKRILVFLLTMIIVLSLAACGGSGNTENESRQNTETTLQAAEEPTDSIPEETEPAATEEPQLHDLCDKFLADGYEGNDYYELVANETEDYQGRTVEVGVIKNNEWLLEPTNDMPLIHSIYGDFLGHNSIYEINATDEHRLMYVGNGCFYYVDAKNYSMNALYNAKINMIFAQYDKLWNPQYIALAKISDYKPTEIFFDTLQPLTPENKDVMVRWYYSDGDSVKVEVLDTTTMEVSTVVIAKTEQDFTINYIYPVSEGLFAAVGVNYPIAFYNLDGKKAFDTSDLHLLSTSNQNIVFNNGECDLEIVNSAKTPYHISIDKTGKVTDSYPL